MFRTLLTLSLVLIHAAGPGLCCCCQVVCAARSDACRSAQHGDACCCDRCSHKSPATPKKPFRCACCLIDRPVVARIDTKPSIDLTSLAWFATLDWSPISFDQTVGIVQEVRDVPRWLDMKTRLSLRCTLLC